MSLLEVQHLKKSFALNHSPFKKLEKNTFLAVNDVSFSIDQGETLGLVGESGCGKSTLAKMILRLIRPDAGRILYGGQDLLTVPKSRSKMYCQKIQIVFQDPYGSLNPRLPIGEIVGEGICLHLKIQRRVVRAKIVELLESVGLNASDMNRYPHEFSGGQRQRIGIARALSVSPSLIILDEPVSSLDVSVQAGIINLLSELQKTRGLTYLFVSHDLSVVRHMSRRVLVMYQGRIIEEGLTEDIFESPEHDYTRELLSSALRIG